MKRTVKGFVVVPKTGWDWTEAYIVGTFRQGEDTRSHLHDETLACTITYDDGKPKRKAKRGRG